MIDIPDLTVVTDYFKCLLVSFCCHLLMFASLFESCGIVLDYEELAVYHDAKPVDQTHSLHDHCMIIALLQISVAPLTIWMLNSQSCTDGWRFCATNYILVIAKPTKRAKSLEILQGAHI